ncbi:hypothetical protein AHiyo1_41620 [Arthrobacter sp. Hiyo1]|uniref:lipopolysaccharide biosynthesis protein n=1 Tax=Arthrobacter sp. Hiyo1 TaxID=1588020 RepID=UPI0006A36B77|nr:hypothetical protein [Arthrobacter sp. Hiyo1]GAP60602.1 hypothetical protein AHiyo1_41620 [Arthrobacter sp. Hiyo1]
MDEATTVRVRSSNVGRNLNSKLPAHTSFFLFQSGPASIIVTTLFVWPLLGHILDQRLLGELSLQLAISSIASPALCLGTNLYLANRLSAGPESDRRSEAKTALWVTGVLYGLSGLLAFSSLFLDAWLFLIPFALSCANAAYLVTSGVMRGIDQPVPYSIVTFVVQIFGLFSLGFLASISHRLQIAVLAYVGVITIPVLWQYCLLRKKTLHTEIRSIVPVLRASASLVPHLVLAVALLMMMRILVSLKVNNEAVANYTFAALIIGGTLTVAASLDAHWSIRAQASPSLASLTGVLRRNQTRIQTILLFMSGGIVLFLFLGLRVWLPPGYDAKHLVLTVLLALPAAAMQALADGRSAVLMYFNKAGRVSIATMVGAVTTLIMAYTLLPIYSWPVAGLCVTAGMFSRMVAVNVFARQIFRTNTVGALGAAMVMVQILYAGVLLAFFFGVK